MFQTYFKVFLFIVCVGELMTSENPSLSAYGYCHGGKRITMIAFAFSRRGLLAYVYSGVSNKECMK